MSDAAPDRSRPRRRAILAAAVVLGTVCITAVVIGVANAPADPGPAPSGIPQLQLVEETLPPGLVLPTAPEEMEFSDSPVDAAVMHWQTELQLAFQGDPNFGSPEISPDGAVFTITLHGEPSAALKKHIERAPEGLDVAIRAADFPPGELRELLPEAMKPGLVPGIDIVMGSVENDGSGLRFGLAAQPEGMTLEEIGQAIGEALELTGVPVRVEISGAVIPING